MNNFLIVDGHSDFLEKIIDYNTKINDSKLMFNVHDVYNYRPYIEFSSIFLHTKYLKNNDGCKRAERMLDSFESNYLTFKDEYNLEKIVTRKSLDNIVTKNKIGLLLTIENLGFIKNDIIQIDNMYKRGVRIASLTWNDKNAIASGAKVKNDTGISEFGRKCIKKLDDLGIVIDVSHLSKKSFKDLIYEDVKHIVATHSSVRGICDNIRNLDDDEIKYIASKGGVIGINFYKEFLTDKKSYATIDDVISHITYISNLVGVDYVGLGSDFDGVEYEFLPIGIKGVRNINNLIDRLIIRRFSNYEIEKIMGQNWYKFLQKIF